MKNINLDADGNLLLEASTEYQTADMITRFRICNGCGSDGSKFDFVPGHLFFLSITDACYIHDWDYAHGLTAKDKLHADVRFLMNMLFLVEAHSCWLLKHIRRYLALQYFCAVRDFGEAAFFAGKIQPTV